MNKRFRHTTVRKTGRESGVTIAMVVLCIAVLFIFAALAVDLGILYTARTSAQHAADAGALAGAYTFLSPLVSQPETAIAAAKDAATKTKILGKTIDPASILVTVDAANRQVSVTVPRIDANAVETFFAGIMGIKSVAIGAKATAQASDSAAGTTCLRPFYMPITAGYTVDKNTAYCTGDPLFDVGTGKLTSYGEQMIGKEMRLWSNDSNGGSIVPGQWGLLDLSGGGGNGIRETIKSCSSDFGLQTACNEALPIDTKNGRNVGPVGQGVGDLIGTGTNGGNYSCPVQGSDVIETVPDTTRTGDFQMAVFKDGVPQIHDGGPDGPLITSSPNIVTVAVWNCLPGGETVSSGKQSITVRGFASVFIQCVDKEKSGNYVKAFLLGVGACGPGSTTGTGPQAIPVRLVQPSTGTD